MGPKISPAMPKSFIPEYMAKTVRSGWTPNFVPIILGSHNCLVAIAIPYKIKIPQPKEYFPKTKLKREKGIRIVPVPKMGTASTIAVISAKRKAKSILRSIKPVKSTAKIIDSIISCALIYEKVTERKEFLIFIKPRHAFSPKKLFENETIPSSSFKRKNVVNIVVKSQITIEGMFFIMLSKKVPAVFKKCTRLSRTALKSVGRTVSEEVFTRLGSELFSINTETLSVTLGNVPVLKKFMFSASEESSPTRVIKRKRSATKKTEEIRIRDKREASVEFKRFLRRSLFNGFAAR